MSRASAEIYSKKQPSDYSYQERLEQQTQRAKARRLQARKDHGYEIETEEQLTKFTNLYRPVLRDRLFKHYLKNGLHTPEELLFFCSEYLHIAIPSQRVCQTHTTPRDFLVKMYFEEVLSSFGYASRASGKTHNTAIYNWLNAVFKGVEVVSAGATREQAQKCYEYFLGCWHDPLVLEHVRVGHNTLTRTNIGTGGQVSIVSGTAKGMNGPHPNKANIDEIELMEWGVLQEGFSMSTAQRGKVDHLIHPGSDILTSTRKKAAGTVDRIISESDKLGITIFTWCVWEVIEKCDHDCHAFHKTHPAGSLYHETVVCPLYEKYNNKTKKLEKFCGGQAHHANGFIPVEEVIKKTQVLDKGTLDAQWLCQKVSDATAVYGEFYIPEIHEITYEQFCSMVSPNKRETLKRIGGIDFGGNHATELALVDITTKPLPTWYWVDEHYTTDDLLNSEHVARIKKLEYWRPGTLFFGDSAQAQDIREFCALGLSVMRSNKEVFQGIDTVKAALQLQTDMRASLYVVRDRCPVLCKQLRAYAHPVGKDGKIDRDRIIKYDDHGPDAIRYAMHTWRTNPLKYKTSLITL